MDRGDRLFVTITFFLMAFVGAGVYHTMAHPGDRPDPRLVTHESFMEVNESHLDLLKSQTVRLLEDRAEIEKLKAHVARLEHQQSLVVGAFGEVILATERPPVARPNHTVEDDAARRKQMQQPMK